MLAIRLDKELEERLTELAKRTGRTKTYYARKAIEQKLQELEDYFLAEDRMQNYQPGDGVPLDQVKRELGLED